MSPDFLFGALPYVALALLIAVPFAKATAERPRRSPSSHALWLGLALVGVGHLIPLLAPHLLAAITRSMWAAVALEALGLVGALLFALGLLARLVGRAPIRSTADAVVLALVFFQALLGIAVALVHRFASLWSATVLTPYLRSLVLLKPDTSQVALTPALVRLHLVMGLLTLAAFAFTPFAVACAARMRALVMQTVHAFSAPKPDVLSRTEKP